MSLFNDASFILIPSGYKAGKLYAEKPIDGNGDLTWTRNSTAYRTQSNGNIGSVGANVPRLSYMYGSCPAVLLEPQRTNVLLWSEDLTTGWNVEGVTVSSNSTTAPDGAITADIIQETAINDVHRVYRNTITITSGSNYAFSFYVKKDTQRYVRLVFNQQSNSAIWVAAQFDLDTQTFTSGVGSGGGTFVSASITAASNGFYRITLVGSLATTGAFAFLALSNGTAISSSDSRGCNIYSGSTSNRLWAWGGQLELGAYATSYIKTEGLTGGVTRIADSFTRDNIYTNGLISASGGVWFLQLTNSVIYLRENSQSSIFINSGPSGNSGNGISIRNAGTTRYGIWSVDAGILTQRYIIVTDNTKLAIRWDGVNCDIFINGTKVTLITGGTSFSFPHTIMENLRGGSANIQQPTFIQAMALYNEPKSDQFCIDLTT